MTQKENDNNDNYINILFLWIYLLLYTLLFVVVAVLLLTTYMEKTEVLNRFFASVFTASLSSQVFNP